ncbi:hypothetical protein I352_01404 [Cryptococcus deuterogattii MMRL2647]|nr:hypothetical protein I352_01404 [Cryptococcus deuterogattii MMRL2647]
MTRGEAYTGTGPPPPADKRVSRYITSPDTTIDTPRVHHSGSYRLDRPYLVSVTAARSHPRFGNASAPVGSGSVAGGSERQEGGVVPDQLLDLQDELDASVEELGRRVTWCGELEEHWKLAQSCLPSSITDSFSRPSYPAYPENDEYNQHAKDTLVKARTDASDVIKKGKEGVDWYMRLLNARGKVLSKHSEIKELEGDIRQLLDFLERGEDMSERPDMSSQHCLDGNFEQWIKAIPSKSAVALQYIEQSESICNRSTFLALQYRNLLKTPPRSIREQAGWETDFVNDDLADQVDIDASQLLELRQQTLAAVQIAKEDIEILDRAQQAFISALSIRNEGLSIQRQLENLIQKTAYPSPQAIQKDHDELKHTVAQLVSRIEKQVMGPFSSFESLIKIHQRQLLSLRQQLLSAISDITDLPSQLSRSMDLLERVQNQTTIVENVEAEAEKMIADVTVIREEAQQTAQREDTNNVLDSLLAKIEKLEKGAKSWESKLSQRVPFLASGTNEHLSSNDLDTIPAVPPHLTLTSSSSAPPMTPPLSRSNTPQQSSTLGVNIYGANSAGLDLASVDGSVKAAVNDQVLAVGSHIAHCKSVCRSTILTNQQQVIPDTPIPPTNTPDVLEPCVVAEDISSSILETPSNDLDLLEQLRKQLDNLQVEEIVHPITLRPTWTLTSRHLPTQKTAEHMAKILGDISGSVQSLVNSSSHVILSEAENLKQSLTSREMLMPRLEQLAQVDGAIKACDDAHSQLLDKIDHYVEQKERLEEAARDAKQALDYVLECSVPVNDDSRVRREVKRLTVTKNDLAILVEECLHPEKLKEKNLVPSAQLKVKEYVPNSRSKLDVAIGKVINTLDIDIPVRPVNQDILGSSSEWQDLSGQYWIGFEGRAKLCFCRILRSRTVMVRVGGGWVELSKYLLDHFTEMMDSFPQQTTAAPSLRRSRSSAISLFNMGVGSPFVAIQFLRKAADSPSAREKEKEKLGSKRSSPIKGRSKRNLMA